MAAYVALGDSMSIDLYTGKKGGGAVAQLYRRLPGNWNLVDRTFDGCRMRQIPKGDRGDLVTVTIGGNDLLARLGWLRQLDPLVIPPGEEEYIPNNVRLFGKDHRNILERIRADSPDALLLVANIYAPQGGLADLLQEALREVNRLIADNVRAVDGRLIDVFTAFAGNEGRYLCRDIEPTLAGATTIADLFEAELGALA